MLCLIIQITYLSYISYCDEMSYPWRHIYYRECRGQFFSDVSSSHVPSFLLYLETSTCKLHMKTQSLNSKLDINEPYRYFLAFYLLSFRMLRLYFDADWLTRIWLSEVRNQTLPSNNTIMLECLHPRLLGLLDCCVLLENVVVHVVSVGRRMIIISDDVLKIKAGQVSKIKIRMEVTCVDLTEVQIGEIVISHLQLILVSTNFYIKYTAFNI